MTLPDAIEPDQVRPLRRAEYDQLVEAGAFADERVELLHGVIVRRSPQGSRHSWCVGRLTMLLVPHVVGRAEVRVQSPFAADDDSEPEPDLCVLPPGCPPDAHPSAAWLVIEVSESSLRRDLRVKVPIYAAAGVPEVWVVDLARGVVHRFTDLADGRYQANDLVTRGDHLEPAHLPGVRIAVAEILP